MFYNQYTWTTGETITADKLNHIEEGMTLIGPLQIVSGVTTIGDMTEALDRHQMMYFIGADHNYYFVHGFGSLTGINFIPSNENITASFQNEVVVIGGGGK